jgi:hypothetical protein
MTDSDPLWDSMKSAWLALPPIDPTKPAPVEKDDEHALTES